MAVMDWTDGDARAHLSRVRNLPEARLCEVARSYDWGRYPETVLGWIMAQKCLDLDTALAAFFAGVPERFNYLHKREVPPEFAGQCRVLDNICLRVNSGFYLPRPQAETRSHEALAKWLAVQDIDRREGAAGRWVFDETIVMPLLSRGEGIEVAAPLPEIAEQPTRAGGPLARLSGLLRLRTAR